MAEGLEKVSIAWHPAFCSAAEFVLRAERENLVFDSEHELSKEPLKIDLLIIKKEKDTVMHNDIAKIFRQYNIIEYKSPGDALTIDDLYKTIAYACLYKVSAHKVNEIPAKQLTMSLFREAYPKKLMQEVIDEGKEIEKTAPGIYIIKDLKPFPAQIVVIKELDPEIYAGFKVLSKNAKESDIAFFLEQARKESDPGELNNINAILQVSVSANQETYDTIKRRDKNMCDALRNLMRDEITAAERQGEARGKEEGVLIGRQNILNQLITKGILTPEQAAQF